MPNTKFDAKSFNAEAFKYKVGTVPNLKMRSKSRQHLPQTPILKAFLQTRTAPATPVLLCVDCLTVMP